MYQADYFMCVQTLNLLAGDKEQKKLLETHAFALHLCEIPVFMELKFWM